MTQSSHVNALVTSQRVLSLILTLRGQRVILAADLARLYAVEVRQLNQAVKRNIERFPNDFVFQLTKAEAEPLSKSQFVTLNESPPLKPRMSRRGTNIKYLPYAFTEHGALMAANVLNSPRAVQASVMVVRAFVRLRQLIATHAELDRKLTELEKKYDRQFKVVFDAIRELMTEPDQPPKPPIGYHSEERNRRQRNRPGLAR